MLESFYKYIVDELLIHYFEQHPISSGNRFYVIIENDVYRRGLLNAMRYSPYAKPIVIKNIYASKEFSVVEGAYNTFTIAPQNSVRSLIIGNSENATEDYLTTLRNAVCSPVSSYSNYGVLYVLSNNRLESLTTASINLQNAGMPLNTSYIKDNIYSKIKNSLMNDNEKLYLYDHLAKMSAKIGDGGYSLFDFKEVLGILQKGGLKKQFNNLGYFEDEDIYDMFFDETKKQVQERISQNFYLYNQVSDAIAQTDGEERKERLSKILDDKLVEKLKKVNNVADIDFSEIKRSVEKKNASAILTFEDAKIVGNTIGVQLLKRTRGNEKKKSSTYMLICDSTNETTTKIRISFSTEIKGMVSDGQVSGRFLYLEVGTEPRMFSVGKDNNIHKFFVKRILAKVGTFDSIQSYFSISKKGVVSVDVPEDVMALSIGCGSTEVIPTFNTLEWNDDYILNVPLENADESDKINMSLSFKGQKTDFVFKLSTVRILPKSPLFLFEFIWTKGKTLRESKTSSFLKDSFLKVYCEEDEFSVYDSFRKYLCLERQMVLERNYSMRFIEGSDEFQGVELDLPDSIKKILDKIYGYFKRENTVPSLCYIDDELENLYKQYLYEVTVQTISAIPENRTMNKCEFALTKLGVVEGKDKIMFSPFNPLLVAFMLEFKEKFDGQDFHTHLLKLISPFYLIPYIYYNSKEMRPYADKDTEDLKTWLLYEDVHSAQQTRSYNITTKMVHDKLVEFIAHFSYLFQDKNCPIVISTIGIQEDSNVIKGILDFIKEEYSKGIVQCIEIHEYVNNILDETFFEKLNRLNSDDLIVKELNGIKCSVESKDYTAHEIIRQLFSRVSFYKHELGQVDNRIGYCHIAFYQMDTGTQYITPPSNDMRVELSMGGLISIPSTMNKEQDYNIGFGSRGLRNEGILYPVVSALNTLYANARNDGRNQFQKSICVAKSFTYKSSDLLESIYENANWVTFLHPEVDVDFFYRQNLYVVHYTDQYTINAKYDSITVTKHISQYENMLRMAYERYTFRVFGHFVLSMV